MFQKPAMTDTLRRQRPLLFAAMALAALACHKQAAAPAPAAIPVQKSSVGGSPSASVAKLLDAPSADERRRPQPPAAPCLPSQEGHEAPLPDLLDQAARDFDKGRYEDALECAREATRNDPGSVAAHHFRGAALAELGHIEEARTAYARALALDRHPRWDSA